MDVAKNSPAEKGGLKRGDLIISAGGKEIASSSELKNIIGSLTPGNEIKLGVIRDKKQIEVSIKIEKMDAKMTQSGEFELIDGLSVATLSEDIRKKQGIPATIKGLLVSGVKEGSLASKLGFLVGDIIVQIENREITSIEDAKSLGNIEGKRVFVNRRGTILMMITSEN